VLEKPATLLSTVYCPLHKIFQLFISHSSIPYSLRKTASPENKKHKTEKEGNAKTQPEAPTTEWLFELYTIFIEH
jgi:hypothetical protein